MRARTIASALAALAAVLLAGCGYRLAGSGAGVFGPDVKTIAVIPFENRTTRPEIEQRVTEEIARELARRGRYEVVADPARADVLLEGAVTSYRTVPVQFTAGGRGTRSEAEVKLQAVARDASTDEVLWSQAGLIFRQQYDVPATGEFFDQETVALDDIARGAAGVLVTSILEGF